MTADGSTTDRIGPDLDGSETARRLTMAVSSRTGNTRKVADAARRALEEAGWQVRERARGEEVVDDVVVVCFWCWKSTLDPLSERVVGGLSGRRILALGTFGGYPGSPYAGRVERNVCATIGERNECLGVFLSQGKVPMDNIESRRALPPEDPHHLDDAGVERVLESQNHPDENDLRRAEAFVRAHLGDLAAGIVPAEAVGA